VYLSLGSVAATIGFFPGLYRTLIDALAELPIRLLVTVGDAADPAELGPLPTNVRVERWIPQASVFTTADAMVGHGGYGTTLGALLAGVPQVVVPLFADQPDNARRIAGLGAGLAADAQDPAGVRAAVERLLAEPAFRVAAGRIALEAQGLAPIDDAPATLQALATDARRRRAA
jgi:MGT family glycosyltransferase